MVSFLRNEIPTVQKVAKVINDEADLPNMSIRTVGRIMNDLGFAYRKRKHQSILIERADIQCWRHRYLRDIKKFRSQGRTIYYTDETWVNFGHSKTKIWEDTSIKSAKRAFLSGLSTGLIASSGKGSRCIVVHAGNENGFIPEACDIFVAKKAKGDYHGEMNSEYYENWFEKKLLPNLQPNSVTVLDNASYHSSVLSENIPSSSTRKADIQLCLTEKNIPWEADMLKAELLVLVSKFRKQFEFHRIDVVAAQVGHTVLRLPSYHCELYPIELI
ncbi:uncharacterized protein LOC118205516 [Stegodyphus dumicola]|uniref:uncharacterized protein LOC118205516 n=1 Tax=Stegodyphus dumicola TaxID=202533 RepID=UPI0015AF74F6|nr:uncharacterized protein LOC118205516 [Stegodyphus dumicola]